MSLHYSYVPRARKVKPAAAAISGAAIAAAVAFAAPVLPPPTGTKPPVIHASPPSVGAFGAAAAVEEVKVDEAGARAPTKGRKGGARVFILITCLSLFLIF